MSEWKTKRFWTEVQLCPVADGVAVQLDGRPVKTPAKAPLVVPSPALARAIADEWDAQDGVIDPTTMPFTRSANAAIDKVRAQKSEVAELVAAYGDSDLLCYRAPHPAALVARQAARWDPVLDWVKTAEGIDLKALCGVVHVPQPAPSLARITAITHAMTAFELTAFHDLVGLSGSFVLGLAVTRGYAAADEIWALSRLDEDWQEEHWGPDDEATAAAEVRKSAFLHAARFFAMVSDVAS